MKAKHVMKLQSGILFLLLLLVTTYAKAQTLTTLYSFTNSGGDGAYPSAGLIMDSSGSLYGTTVSGGASDHGTVFELAKNSDGTYTETVLYRFTDLPDGAFPYASLIMDKSGNLYGTTSAGGSTLCNGGCGTVFELVNNSGTYTEKVLYSFGGTSQGDGTGPSGGLIRDSSGNLYGRTAQGGPRGAGTVFELVNSSDAYTEKVLYSFPANLSDGAGPNGGLIMDASGNLYGTAAANPVASTACPDGCGIVFELVSSSGAYTEKILHRFTGPDGWKPRGGLIRDSAGNLFGTTELGGTACGGGCGTVFELVNNSGTYRIRTLYSFTGPPDDGSFPDAGPMMDSAGNLYGTTSVGGGAPGNGTVFELVKSSGYGETVLHGFSGPDGYAPFASLIMDSAGKIYGTTTRGGTSTNCTYGCGTVFEVTLPSTTSNAPGLSANNTFTGSNTLYVGARAQTTSAEDDSAAAATTTVVTTPAAQWPDNQDLPVTATVAPSTPPSNPANVEPIGGVGAFYIDGSLFAPCSSQGFSFNSANGSATAQCTIPAGTLSDGEHFLSVYFSSSATSLYLDSYGFTFINVGGPGLSANNTFTGSNTFTQIITGSITGNAGTVTNGLYTTGSYADPSWLTSLSGSKIVGPVASATEAGMAATAGVAGALSATPTQCGTNQFSTGIAANGNANCLQPASANLSDVSNLAFNNQANIFTGGKQTLPPSAPTYASLNIPNTGQLPSTPMMGDLWSTIADPHLMFVDSTSTTQRLAFLTDVTSSSSSLLGANNTFTGNNSFSQIISGNISGNAATVSNGVYATGSYADPAWITALSGSKIIGSVANATNATNATTAGSATTAGTATTAASATTAGNAANLGGIAAADYARVDIGNSFAGDQTVTGNLNVTGTITGTVIIGNSGTPIKEHLSVLVNPSFPALLPFMCATANFTVAGTTDGNTIALGVPNERMNQGGHIVYTAWVSAANTVTVQACNIDSLNKQKAAGTGSIRVDVWMY